MNHNTPRPTLRSFRVLALECRNKGEAAGANMQMTVQQDIEVGLAVPIEANAPLMVGVSIKLAATTAHENNASDRVMCAGQYEAKFYFPLGVPEETANALLDDRDYQYGLVAQAFPLAMTHFRRALQAMGVNAQNLPLGLAYAA